jgi:hypothetical protein
LYLFTGETGPVEPKIKKTTHAEQEREDREYYRSLTPQQRLEIVEQLRLQAGKFLYEYPSPFQRIITVIRKPEPK